MAKNIDEFLSVSEKEYLPLRDVVFMTIRDAILTGKLEQGQRLMENQLAESIGVSRTPVREALRMLELEGFVEMVPRKGALVKTVTEKDIRDVLEIREALEALAARLACRYMRKEDMERLGIIKREFESAVADVDMKRMVQKDEEFHELIFASGKNKKLLQITHNLSEQIYRYRFTYLQDKNCRNSIITEHAKITEALGARNEDEAVKAAAEHIKNQERSIVRLIQG